MIDLDLNAPHCKVKVLGVIQDACTPTDGQSFGRSLETREPPKDPYDISIGLSCIPLNNICA